MNLDKEFKLEQQVKNVHQKWVNILIMFLFAIQITLNFYGSPLVKYNYIAIIIANILGVLILPNHYAIWNLLLFIMFEGQGRMVWGYHPFSRIIFDLICLIFVLKVFIGERKILDSSKLPKFIQVMILLHFMWWILEIFNPAGAGFIPSFITSKYYIFPFLLFFSFLLTPLDFEMKEVHKGLWFFMVISIAMTVLCHLQNEEGLSYLTDISGHYLTLFEKYEKFVGLNFRPWGTSFVPGGMSTFVYSTIGLFFIFDEKIAFSSRKAVYFAKFGKYVFLIFSLYSAFISQVRSAFIKSLLIFIVVSFIVFMSSRFKIKTMLLTFIVGCSLLFFSIDFNRIMELANVAGALQRYEQLDQQGVAGQRSGFKKVYETLVLRVELPFGYGLGMTTGYSPAFAKRRAERVEVPNHHFWSLDNLYAFLILELGFGGFIYISLILTINFLLAGMMLIVYKNNDRKNLVPLVASFGTFAVLIVGNWGAVAMPFNPESFFAWLWVSIGFKSYYNYLNDKRRSVET